MADLSSPPSPELQPSHETLQEKNWGEWVFFGPNGLRAGWRLLIFVALFAGVSFSSRFILISIFHPQHGGAISWRLLSDAVGFACALLSAWIMSRIEHRPVGVYGLPRSHAFGRNFWVGAVWGAVAVSALVLSIRSAHGLNFDGIALDARSAIYYGSFWFVGFITVGLLEEFLVRGYPQFTLASGIGFWPAAAILSCVFGAGHLGNPGEAWVGAVTAGLIGLWFAFTLRRTGDLWFAVGFHALFDYGETFAYSVPNSGISFQGQLLHTTSHGPRWVTGGSVGPEGSAFTFIMIALLFVIFDRMYPAKKLQPIASYSGL
jgi:membrane protease YdiL (CAAX protease family)